MRRRCDNIGYVKVIVALTLALQNTMAFAFHSIILCKTKWIFSTLLAQTIIAFSIIISHIFAGRFANKSGDREIAGKAGSIKVPTYN